MRERNLMDRFWNKVDAKGPDECWPWEAVRLPNGYGRFLFRRHQILAHRFALSQALGRPIVNGMCVLHSCNNPPCCNPTHLREGTDADNTADMVAMGRQAQQSGEQNPNAKLSWPDVRRIRELYTAGGHTHKKLGREFGVSRRMITLIVNHKRWKEG